MRATVRAVCPPRMTSRARAHEPLLRQRWRDLWPASIEVKAKKLSMAFLPEIARPGPADVDTGDVIGLVDAARETVGAIVQPAKDQG